MIQNPSRRRFLKDSAKYSLILGGAGAILSSPAWLRWLFLRSPADAIASGRLDEIIRAAPVARFWASTANSAGNCTICHGPGLTMPDFKHDEELIKCLLCAQGCVIRDGERGKCRTRINVNGKLHTLSYGRPISTHVDPIEKKPLYHFLPGATAFSLATAGCPLHCKFCQNWEIAQSNPEDFPDRFVSPAQIVDATVSSNSPVIAFTYNEPTVFTEYLLDIARLGSDEGRRSVLISCGFMNEAPLREMCETLDAIKIDLKGFSREFYQKVCGAELSPVLRSIKQVAHSSAHLEIVNLVVPTLNDSDDMLTGLAEWVFNEAGPDIPIHFTRFHPDYQMRNLPPTPISTLEKARDIAIDRGIHYAFVGNVPGHPGNHSYCPKCGRIVIERQGFFIRHNQIVDGKCRFCGEPIAGVWS